MAPCGEVNSDCFLWWVAHSTRPTKILHIWHWHRTGCCCFVPSNSLYRWWLCKFQMFNSFISIFQAMTDNNISSLFCNITDCCWVQNNSEFSISISSMYYFSILYSFFVFSCCTFVAIYIIFSFTLNGISLKFDGRQSPPLREFNPNWNLK